MEEFAVCKICGCMVYELDKHEVFHQTLSQNFIEIAKAIEALAQQVIAMNSMTNGKAKRPHT